MLRKFGLIISEHRESVPGYKFITFNQYGKRTPSGLEDFKEIIFIIGGQITKNQSSMIKSSLGYTKPNIIVKSIDVGVALRAIKSSFSGSGTAFRKYEHKLFFM